MENQFTEFSYLKQGNTKQRAAYDVLEKLKLFTFLNRYNSVLVGTIPIDIDIANSDLDIIYEVHEHDVFERTVESLYGSYDAFCVSRAVGGRTGDNLCEFCL